MTLRIGILGANGQVGSELALLLANEPGHTPHGVVRSGYGAALLRLSQVSHAVAGFDDAAALRSALRDCDVVVDLTYPGGQFVDIPGALAKNLRAIMTAMKPGARYMHMSSIMAFGTSSGASELRDRRFPRASYGYIKRWGEGEAVRVGRELGVETYVFRLGQVHGLLQGVSQEYRRRAEAGRLSFVGEAGSLSTTLFPEAIVGAIKRCAEGALVAGRVYTLISNPQWTLAELGAAYRELFNPTLEISYEPLATPRPQPLALLRGLGTAPAVRDLLETYVLMRTPGLFIRAKGKFRARSVRRDTPIPPPRADESLPCLVGPAPRLVPGIDSSVATTVRTQRELGVRFDAMLQAARR